MQIMSVVLPWLAGPPGIVLFFTGQIQTPFAEKKLQLVWREWLVCFQTQTAMSRSQSRLSRIKGLSYVPGGPVKKTRCAAAETTTLRRKAVFPGFPVDVLDRIVSLLVDAKAAGSVMMLSMVDRALRSAITDNAGAWHKLYMHWRGPLTYQSRAGGAGNLFVSRTIPRTLPNFRVKHISVT